MAKKKRKKGRKEPPSGLHVCPHCKGRKQHWSAPYCNTCMWKLGLAE